MQKCHFDLLAPIFLLIKVTLDPSRKTDTVYAFNDFKKGPNTEEDFVENGPIGVGGHNS